MRTGLLLAVLVTGCGLGVVGVSIDDDAGTPTPDAGRGPMMRDDGGARPSDAAGVVDATADGPPGSRCEAEECPGRRCETNACSAFGDCKALHAARPSEPSGIYELRRGATTVQAYCEMVFDQGGWTLVGQSAENGTGAFGWNTRRGDVRSVAEPYAIGAVELGLATDELLLAAGSRSAFTIAYRLRPPEGFPGDLQTVTGSTQGLVKLKNDLCSGASGDSPKMLEVTGRTNRSEVFFFGDLTEADDLGLRAGGWSLRHDNSCPETGRMQNEPGLLFAR